MQVRIILIATMLTMTLVAKTSRAESWSGEVRWPTFYRAGPGRNYTVIDELDRGASLEVLSCRSGWCKVRDDDSIGFVEQKWIRERNAMPPKPQQTVEADCVQARSHGIWLQGRARISLLFPRHVRKCLVWPTFTRCKPAISRQR